MSQCTGQALQNRRPAHKKEGAAKKEHNSITQRQEKELLSVASSLQGQGLLAGGAGNMAFTRRALEAFLESAKSVNTRVYTLYTCLRTNTHTAA